ncbi:hypothetical protein [Streptomyces sp. NBC_00091]|uniref:hypothetical protein n=1 Tax=Streptomyces sp. NBC_00091 TaxID=2975648 RepID=UPI00224CA3EF|nr:hypothetical protein [Streptomyces sp. NBC_00091]MCX5379982.1 hypothetical protein [Streptomyces sp. NBC_00091]
MTLIPLRPGALLLALSASLLPLIASSAPAAALADPVPQWHHHRHQHTADEISRFLTAFYGDHGPSARDRSQRISPQLKEKQAYHPYADVVLCAQGTPQDITVGPATVAKGAGVGWATVTTSWASGATDTFTAYVRLDSRPIALDDVICAG